MAASGASAALPLAAICCLALILFGIAATVVLALIPIYIPAKNINTASKNAVTKTLAYSIPVPSNTATTTLTSAQLAQLSSQLSTSQTTSTLNNGGVTASGGSVVSSGRRKRQSTTAKFLILIVIINGRDQSSIRAIEKLLTAYIQQNSAALGLFVESLVGDQTTTVNPSLLSTTTTVNPAVVSTVAPGRRRRQQTNQGAFPSAPLVTYQD